MKVITFFKNIIHIKTFLVSFILSLIWILGTDFIVHNLIPDKMNTETLQNLKGILYIFVLSLILSWLHKKEIKALKLLMAERRQSVLGEFSSMIVHEFRNPLHSIHLCIQRIRELLSVESNATGSAKSEKYINQIDQSIGRLNDTINFLQSLSRGGSIDGFRKDDLIDLGEKAEKTFDFLIKSFSGLNIHLNKVDIEGLTIRGNTSLLSHVFLNLIKNSMDYIRDEEIAEGEIILSHETSDEFIIIGLANSGKPIAKEIQVKLFSHYTSKEGKKGTGLGLIFCKQIMQAHGGDIEYDATSLMPKFLLKFPKN